MQLSEIKYCPATLAESNITYSASALRKMFFGKKISHILNFDSISQNPEIANLFLQNSKSISISGVQFKQSLWLNKNKLQLTEANQKGQYILKPIPINPAFANANELPANEHLTMQIASQVYAINTAQCALVFFKNGEPAYISKRFDYDKKGNKIQQEDFASLMGKSKSMHGENYRSEGSYEDMAHLLYKYTTASYIEIEKLFTLILFNYLFSNGDAHLKNFSLQQTAFGDYILSPAYDLINTRLHIQHDSFFGMLNGLYEDDFETKSFSNLGFYAYDDFYYFGLKIGVKELRIRKILQQFMQDYPLTHQLILRSFLSENLKKMYRDYYLDRLNMLNQSFEKIC
jgi:serine/threonine-protein kinase HipA